MAEENRRHKMQSKIDVMISEPETVALPPETKPKKAQTNTTP
jgi:hypothetical protein